MAGLLLDVCTVSVWEARLGAGWRGLDTTVQWRDKKCSLQRLRSTGLLLADCGCLYRQAFIVACIAGAVAQVPFGFPCAW